jgi:large subunit ribosomal protein L15
MDLSKIRIKNKNKTQKRLGRGSGSGWGKTAGRGNKGAGQRAGSVLPYSGFNGGNIPYVRKIPKRGFTAFNSKTFQVVNLKDIVSRIKEAKEIDPRALENASLIKNADAPIKILADMAKTKLNLKAVFKADAFSRKAKELILAAGGDAQCLKR